MAKSSTNPGVLKVIKDEHDEVKGLFEKFAHTIDHDKNQARAISVEILNNLLAHTQLEEDIVYPTLKKQDQSLFYEAVEEHHVADVLIEEVRQLKVEDPAYPAKMEVLRTNVEHHMEEEEDEMFHNLKELPKETLEQMAEKWHSMKPRKMQQVTR